MALHHQATAGMMIKVPDDYSQTIIEGLNMLNNGDDDKDGSICHTVNLCIDKRIALDRCIDTYFTRQNAVDDVFDEFEHAVQQLRNKLRNKTERT